MTAWSLNRPPVRIARTTRWDRCPGKGSANVREGATQTANIDRKLCAAP